jgi:hypothetical protein
VPLSAPLSAALRPPVGGSGGSRPRGAR